MHVAFGFNGFQLQYHWESDEEGDEDTDDQEYDNLENYWHLE